MKLGIALALVFFSGAVFYSPLAGDASPMGATPRHQVAGHHSGRVVILAIDRLSPGDLQACSHWRSLADRGASGLMNDNTAGGCTPANGYLTMGAGSHLTAGSFAGNAVESMETTSTGNAGWEFHARTGLWPSRPSVVVLDIAGIKRIAGSLPYPGQPGLLGESLHRAGFKTCVLGNADTLDLRQRFAPLLAMDQGGLVDGGDIGPGNLVHDPVFPGGLRAENERLLAAFRSHPADLTVIDPGDLDRLDLLRTEIDEPIWNSLRSEALTRFDALLGDLANELNFDHDLLLVVTPVPARLQPPGPSLVPVLAVGPSLVHGALTSPTTRREGLVANIDIAPTVLSFFGLPQPPEMAGRSLYSLPRAIAPARLAEIADEDVLTYRARPYLQRVYVGGQFAALGLSAWALLSHRRRGTKALLFYYLSLLAVPLAYLLAPLKPVGSVPILGLEVGTAALLLAVASVLGSRLLRLDPFVVLCLATATILLIDLLAGAPLGHRAVMGYDFIDGARYYGLGNEYMGVLIGSAVVGMTGLFRRFPSRWALGLVCGFYAVTLLATGAPQVGANAGGAIAVAAAFASNAFLLGQISLNRRSAVVIAGLVLVAVASMAFWDFHRPVAVQSHIGRAAGLVFAGEWPGLVQIIARKLSMNYRLIRYTIWARIFVVSLVCLALALQWPREGLVALRAREPFVFKSVAGVVVGSLTALIFNDSGVVAAATAIIFACPQLIGLLLRESERGIMPADLFRDGQNA